MRRAMLVLAMGALPMGCAHTRPPRELLDARIEYQRAIVASGAPLVAQDLHEARMTLADAERTFDEEGPTDEARTLAYVAQRRAIATQARAAAARALEARRAAAARLARLDRRTTQTGTELVRASRGHRQVEPAAPSERRARARVEPETQRDATPGTKSRTTTEARTEAKREAKTEDLLERIDGVRVALTARGLVVTLSGSGLFASGTSELQQDGERLVRQIARAIEGDERQIAVVGHTDSRGTDEENDRLSEERASSVRKVLVREGIDARRVRAEGMGESQPVADNATTEGRAQNRRVEIVLERTRPARSGDTPRR